MLNKEEMEAEREAVNEQYREWRKEKKFVVQDVEFEYSKLPRDLRVRVIATHSEIEPAMIMGNYNFLIDKNFQQLRKEIESYVTLDGMQITKIPDFWDEDSYAYLELEFLQIYIRIIVFVSYDKKKATS